MFGIAILRCVSRDLLVGLLVFCLLLSNVYKDVYKYIKLHTSVVQCPNPTMFYVLCAIHATLISDLITFNQEAAYVHLKFKQAAFFNVLAS